MGLRQPTKVGAFFAQTAAGTQQQAEARKKLQKPQALGGAASVGTQMVANTAQAQAQETGEVKKQTGAAATDIAVRPMVGQKTTEVVTNIGNNAATKGGGPPELKTLVSGDAGDLDATIKSGEEINKNVQLMEKNLASLDTALKTATESDAIAINKEKERLTNLLQEYRDKVSKGNLGEIAGPSEYETLMEEQAMLMGTQGQDIGKLKNIFGPRWDRERYGALESQIYGKDLEALSEEATSAIGERQRSKSEAAAALTGYEEQLGRSKKSYEETLDKKQQAVDILKKTPEELAGYTRKQLEDIYGKDKANKFFTFLNADPNAPVTGTTVSNVKTALSDRLTQQKAEQEKFAGEKEKAKTKMEENFGKTEKEIFGDVNSKGGIEAMDNSIMQGVRNSDEIVRKITKITESWFAKEWEGISRDSSIAAEVSNKSRELRKELKKKSDEIELARKNKDTTKMQKLYNDYMKYAREKNKELANTFNQISPTARRLIGS